MLNTKNIYELSVARNCTQKLYTRWANMPKRRTYKLYKTVESDKQSSLRRIQAMILSSRREEEKRAQEQSVYNKLLTKR